jgi:hypothetical protein
VDGIEFIKACIDVDACRTCLTAMFEDAAVHAAAEE